MPRALHFHQLDLMLELIQEHFQGLRPESLIWCPLRLCPGALSKQSWAIIGEFYLNTVELMIELNQEHSSRLHPEDFISTDLSLCSGESVDTITADAWRALFILRLYSSSYIKIFLSWARGVCFYFVEHMLELIG